MDEVTDVPAVEGGPGRYGSVEERRYKELFFKVCDRLGVTDHDPLLMKMDEAVYAYAGQRSIINVQEHGQEILDAIAGLL